MSYNIYQNVEYSSQIRNSFLGLDKEKALAKAKSAVHNPKTDWIHLETDDGYKLEQFAHGDLDWSLFPKARNVKLSQENKERYLSGATHMNKDQASYNHFSDEYLPIAQEYYESKVKTHSAGVITSTDFPSITVTTATQDIINKERIELQKYNLLNIWETINTEQILVRFPEYDDQQMTVKTGYQEGDPIDLIGIGAFTERTFGLQKAGAKVAYTEEFFMRDYEFPVNDFLLQKIAGDFVRVKHNRVLDKLADFTDQTGSGDWAAFVATDFHSTRQPVRDLTTAKIAINTDKRAAADTIISNENQWVNYTTNTWTKGIGAPQTSPGVDQNGIIRSPIGVPWAREWILNEDIPVGTVYVLDRTAFVHINGPRRVAQGQTLDPVQSILVQKQWFEIHLKEQGFGREITGVGV